LKTRILFGFFLFLLLAGSTISSFGQEVQEKTESEGKFDASTFILDHIADSHEWHILTRKNGEEVALYLPVILYSKEKGFDIFSSKKISGGNVYKGYKLEEEGDLKGKIVKINQEGIIDKENLPIDFSMTKAVIGLLAAAIIGLFLFLSLSRSYRKSGISHPRGLQSFLEPLILFVRDDIAIPNIGIHKYEKYMPYLLSAFFFILINNLMGLIPFPPPFGANVTGNIAVTFAAPGVPLWLLPIMIPVEIIGLFSKPFALMIRLFANITAGHIIVLSLICLIFIFNSLSVAPVSIFFVIFMDFLELLVALLQAYIFTLLSSLFIGMAIPDSH
jgi:F-type H+-transporting ATPase subunit a